MTKEEAKKILAEYVKACNEDDMLTLEQFVYEEVMEAMSMGAEALSKCLVSSNLEEAAVDIADALLAKPKDYVLSAKADYWNGAHDGIIAGAKWQAEQLLKSSPLPEDTVLFNKGVEEGKRLMMKEAVEHYVIGEIAGSPVGSAIVHYDDTLNPGDKVKVIIIKEDK